MSKKITPPVLKSLEELWLHDFGLGPTESLVEDGDVSFLQVLLVDDRLDVVKGMAEIGVLKRGCRYHFEAKVLRCPLVAANLKYG